MYEGLVHAINTKPTNAYEGSVHTINTKRTKVYEGSVHVKIQNPQTPVCLGTVLQDPGNLKVYKGSVHAEILNPQTPVCHNTVLQDPRNPKVYKESVQKNKKKCVKKRHGNGKRRLIDAKRKKRKLKMQKKN